MEEQGAKIRTSLLDPDTIIRSMTDPTVRVYYRFYDETPVTTKHMSVVVKEHDGDSFIVTAYFTDRVKQGEVLWTRK